MFYETERRSNYVCHDSKTIENNYDDDQTENSKVTTNEDLV